MKRITVTLPDDLERDLTSYLDRQEVPPSLTTVAQVALREFLRSQELRERGLQPATKPFAIPVMPEKDADGEADVSVDHDRYLAEAAADRST